MSESAPAAPSAQPAPAGDPLPDFFAYDQTDSSPMFSVIWGGDDSEDLRFRTLVPYIAVEAVEYDRQKGIVTIHAGLRRIIANCSKRQEMLRKRRGATESHAEASQSPDDMCDRLETHRLVSLFTDAAGGVTVQIELVSDDDEEEGGDGFGDD